MFRKLYLRPCWCSSHCHRCVLSPTTACTQQWAELINFYRSVSSPTKIIFPFPQCLLHEHMCGQGHCASIPQCPLNSRNFIACPVRSHRNQHRNKCILKIKPPSLYEHRFTSPGLCHRASSTPTSKRNKNSFPSPQCRPEIALRHGQGNRLVELPELYEHSSARFYITGEQGVYSITSFMELRDIDLTRSRT